MSTLVALLMQMQPVKVRRGAGQTNPNYGNYWQTRRQVVAYLENGRAASPRELSEACDRSHYEMLRVLWHLKNQRVIEVAYRSGQIPYYKLR